MCALPRPSIGAGAGATRAQLARVSRQLCGTCARSIGKATAALWDAALWDNGRAAAMGHHGSQLPENTLQCCCPCCGCALPSPSLALVPSAARRSHVLPGHDLCTEVIRAKTQFTQRREGCHTLVRSNTTGVALAWPHLRLSQLLRQRLALRHVLDRAQTARVCATIAAAAARGGGGGNMSSSRVGRPADAPLPPHTRAPQPPAPT